MRLCIFCFFYIISSSFANQEKKTLIREVLQEVSLTWADIIDEAVSNRQCATDLKMTVTSFLQIQPWAWQMLDASAKLNSGILSGNIFFHGNYDECMDIRHEHANGVIQGQYCTVVLDVRKNVTNSLANVLDLQTTLKKLEVVSEDIALARYMKISFGVCLPKSCTYDDLNQVWEIIENMFNLPMHVSFNDELCNYKGKSIEPYKIDILIYIFFGIVFIVIVASTMYDLNLRSQGKDSNFLSSCSLYSNTIKLFSTHCENEEITSLYGIKYLACVWMVIGHFVLVKTLAMNNNSTFILSEWLNDWKSSFILSALFCLETFYTLSGFLVTFLYLNYSDKYRIHAVYFYLYRFIRFTPPIFAMVLFHIGIIKQLLNGLFGNAISKILSRGCYHTGWATLAFLTGYVPHIEKCLVQTWHLTIDSQLYLLAPIFLFNIKKHPKMVLSSMFIISTGCVLYTFTAVLKKNITCGWIVLDPTECQEYLYFFLPARIPCYFIGCVLGYLFYKNQNFKGVFPTKTTYFWLSVSIFYLVLFIYTYIDCIEYQNNPIFSAFYNTVARVLWSLAICVIIYSSSINKNGLINRILSQPLFYVFGKLSYSMFLTHLTVLFVLIGNQKESSHFDVLNLIFECSGFLVLTVSSSYILFICFEAPVYTILKNIEQRIKTLKIEESERNSDNDKLIDKVYIDRIIDKLIIRYILTEARKEIKSKVQ